MRILTSRNSTWNSCHRARPICTNLASARVEIGGCLSASAHLPQQTKLRKRLNALLVVPLVPAPINPPPHSCLSPYQFCNLPFITMWNNGQSEVNPHGYAIVRCWAVVYIPFLYHIDMVISSQTPAHILQITPSLNLELQHLLVERPSSSLRT